MMGLYKDTKINILSQINYSEVAEKAQNNCIYFESR